MYHRVAVLAVSVALNVLTPLTLLFVRGVDVGSRFAEAFPDAALRRCGGHVMMPRGSVRTAEGRACGAASFCGAVVAILDLGMSRFCGEWCGTFALLVWLLFIFCEKDRNLLSIYPKFIFALENKWR